MSDAITLYCPSCGGKTHFSAEDNLFVCEYCGNRHAFKLHPLSTDTSEVAREDKQAPPVEPKKLLWPRPKEVTVEKLGTRLYISRRWYSLKYIPLAFFCVFWNGFLCCWYGIGLSQGIPISARAMILIFPLLHDAVGIGLTYTTLAGFLNRTILSVDQSSLTIRHHPLPWMGEVSVPLTDIDQLYCEEKRSTGENSSTTYNLNAVLKSGRKITLISKLDAPDIAFFIEQQVENWLQIPDQRVAGEHQL